MVVKSSLYNIIDKCRNDTGTLSCYGDLQVVGGFRVTFIRMSFHVSHATAITIPLLDYLALMHVHAFSYARPQWHCNGLSCGSVGNVMDFRHLLVALYAAQICTQQYYRYCSIT